MCLFLLPLGLPAQVPEDSYFAETLSTPPGIAPEVTAITFARDGHLYACFRRGAIWSTVNALSDRTVPLEWRLFASGLQVPLGILPGKSGEFFVAQMPELTRIVDTDGNGRADLYETVCDKWGMSGNYHEFVYGPLLDGEGNFYVALGSASSLGESRSPVRGIYTAQGRKGDRYQHFSAVPYRGWIVRISPSGQMVPISSGLRQPNGLVFNPEGDLFVVDNQGDWVGTSPLHHVTPAAFHGHPSSLVWDPGFTDSPMEVPVEHLQSRRKLPAIQIPQNDMAGSIAQPAIDTTNGKFGPYENQMFVADWSYPRLHRVVLEKVGGQYQGACFPFMDGGGLRRGNQDLAFGPDGSLYVAQVSRVWGGSEDGLQRVVWTGELPMDILTMSLTERGFDLTFTKPVDPESIKDPSAFSIEHFYYLYHPQYGSPKTDVKVVRVKKVSLSRDGLTLSLILDGLVPSRVYQWHFRGIKALDGDELVTETAAYTLNRLRD